MTFLSGLSVGVLLGAVLGVVGCVFVWERVFEKVARFQRTGRPEAPKLEAATEGGTPDGNAAARISEASLSALAEEVMELAANNGRSITPTQARVEAERLLASSGEDGMFGGIPNG